MEEFIENFADVLDIDPSELTAETEFRSLEEWDSIAALSVIGMVDEEYNVVLNAEDMRSSGTIAELYDKIKTKK